MVSLVHVLAVAEHLNFHHAANVLGTTQSCVSARIKSLEQTLGILLFEHRHRGVRLTEAGRHFVAEVSAGIAQLDHSVRTAGARLDGTEESLAIGLHSPISHHPVAPERGQCIDAEGERVAAANVGTALCHGVGKHVACRPLSGITRPDWGGSPLPEQVIREDSLSFFAANRARSAPLPGTAVVPDDFPAAAFFPLFETGARVALRHSQASRYAVTAGRSIR